VTGSGLAVKATKINSRDELDEDEEDDEGDEEEKEDAVEVRDDPANLFDEGVVFKNGRQHEDEDFLLTRGSRHPSRSSSIASGFHTGPPTTDDDEMMGLGAEDDKEEEEQQVVRTTKKHHNHIEKKLVKERPVITTKSKTPKAPVVELSDSDAEESSPWLPRTELVFNDCGSALRVNLKQQSPEIKAVSDVPALAWRPEPARASHQKPGQARLFTWLSKAYGSGLDFGKPWAMAQAVALSCD